MSQNKSIAPEKTHVLVIANVNWADEMDIGGFKIFESETWEKFKSDWEKKDYVNFYIGTNEDLEYSSGKEYLRDLRAKPITKAEADHLNDLFGGNWRTDVTDVIRWPDGEEFDDE